MRKSIITILALFFISILPGKAFPQLDLLDKVKEKVQSSAEDKAREAAEKKENEDTQNQEEKNEPSLQGTSRTEDASGKQEDGLKSYSKFDFVPGEQVVYYEDFAGDEIGEFPLHWNTNGTGEVVTLNKYPGKWLKGKNGSLYVPELPSPMPENFTIEFNMIVSGKPDVDYIGNVNFNLIAAEGSKDYLQHAYTYSSQGKAFFGLEIAIKNQDASTFYATSTINGGEEYAPTTELNDRILTGKFGKIVKIAISVQKNRFRMWCDGKKIFDMPKVFPVASYDVFKAGLWYFGDDDTAYEVYFSNFRFAIGLPDLRSKLLTDGKLVTRGITFDSGSDKIKPESYGTLKEIAKILNDNPEIKVKIIGHTDSDGTGELNLELSKKRSAAIKAALSSEFGIGTARMDTDGKGAFEPVSDNKTPSGKANNRRVEFIRM